MKKWSAFAVLIFIILVLYLFTNRAYGMSQLISCFEESGADFVKMDIEGYGKINTEDNLNDVVVKMFKSSSLKGEYSIIRNEDATLLTLNSKDFEVTIKAKKIPDENLIYASFLYSHNDNNENINNIRRTISKAFKAYNAKPSFSSLIYGKYNSELSVEQMKEVGKEIFFKSGARLIDGVDDGKMVSIYGYLPNLKDKVKTMNDYVNLNIGLRYSKANSYTYILIGSPIITAEY